MISISKKIKYLISLYWPSKKFTQDPFSENIVDERYIPIPLNGWKLIPWVAKDLVLRRISIALSFSKNKLLAVIIPVRDRDDHLSILIPRLRRILDAQQICYKIFVIEQSKGSAFNKGALINTGFKIIGKNFDYICLHDADAIPVQANYHCPSVPLRLVHSLIDSVNGDRRDKRYFGGVICLKIEHFSLANGFSNNYWGWGKEDDDFLFRLWFSGLTCYFDSMGCFEDLKNPEGQGFESTKYSGRKNYRRNRSTRSRMIRGIDNFLMQGLNTVNYPYKAVNYDLAIRYLVYI